MTPLFRTPEPDERPSDGEIVGALLLAVVLCFLVWIVAIFNMPLAP